MFQPVKILLTGATGRLGRSILSQPRDGLAVRAISRSVHAAPAAEWVTADLVSGAGLDEALRGVDVIVHAASNVTASADVDVRGTEGLVRRARAAGVPHIVYVSIVGIDRLPTTYYAHKLAAEAAVMNGGVPWTILRATQFHSYVDFLMTRAAAFPLLMLYPAGFSFQSIDVREVAARVLVAARGKPQGRLRDIAGPEVLSFRDMARQWKAARHIAKPLIPVPLLSRAAAAFRKGHNTAPGGDLGKVTWAEWLRSTPP